MKKNTFKLLFSTLVIISILSCDNKKTKDEKNEVTKEIDSTSEQLTKTAKNSKSEVNLSFQSYDFAENLKNDSFFESDNTDKMIQLKNVGITSYFISGNEVTLSGIFYNKEKNLAIPRYNNNPPGRAFVSEYFDQLEIKYDEKYKTTYSATLRISLKNPKDVKKLKMYLANEPVLNYEYKVSGTLDEYRSGFIDLINIEGIFKGISPDGIYPNKIYEIVDAEIY